MSIFFALIHFVLNVSVVILLAAGLYYLYFKRLYGYWKRKGVPYIDPPPIFSSRFTQKHVDPGFHLKSIYEELKARGAKYGGFYEGSSASIIIIDPDVLRLVLTKDFTNFMDRGFHCNEDFDPLGSHLFMLSGQRWRNLRAKFTPTFTSGKMKMMFSIMAECSNQLVERVDSLAKDQTPVEIKEILACFTTDIIGSCAFGLDCNSFKEDDAAFRKLGREFLNPVPKDLIRMLFVYSFPRLARLFKVKSVKPEIEKFFMNIVKDTVEYRERTKSTRNDFMQLLINLKNDYSSEEPLTMNQLSAQAFVFFVAGFETSSTAMSFCFYELAVNPDIQEKARKEVVEVLEKHKGAVTYEAIQEMKYLAQVLDETLRKYPPLPLLQRQCVQKYVNKEAGVEMEKGQGILISILGLHYDPEHFPDPEKFDPDRFSEQNRSNIKPYTYMPFGEGPRNCIGIRFGLLQAKVGLAILLKNFEFSLNAKTKTPLNFVSKMLILTNDSGIWVNAKKIE